MCLNRARPDIIIRIKLSPTFSLVLSLERILDLVGVAGRFEWDDDIYDDGKKDVDEY